jgi:hypothetical protein
MKIKEYSETWPPIFTIGAGADFMGAKLADTVFSVREYAETKDRLVLSARNQSGVTYDIPLSLPAGVLERALIVINENLPITLRGVGELNI